MKSLLRTIALSALCLSPLATLAVPAYPGWITVTQPDGVTTLQVRMVGDEFSHYFLTTDGVPLVADGKSYCYATLDGAKAVSTAVTAHEAAMRSANEHALVAAIDRSAVTEALAVRRSTNAKRRIIAQSGVGVSSSFDTSGDMKALVMLVEYADVACSTPDPNTYFTNMLNQEGFSENSCTGSARDYFIASSNNQFRPQFDVYGPVTLSHNRAYYGASDSKAAEMIVEAAKLLDSQINFKDYDLDGDGIVENVYLFYAGEGENTSGDSDMVWPHQWTLSAAGYSSVRHDGVKLNQYSCSNESTSSGATTAIGTFIHEFSHSLGLPDLYSGDVSTTPGYWDVMDIGCYLNNGRTPPTYSSFERNGLCWTIPQVLTTSADEVTLNPLDTHNTCCLIPTSSYNEFYLLENRQAEGWDRYVPGHGLLIWHIDYDMDYSSGINSNASHQTVDIVEANSNPNRNDKSVQAGYTFPGTTGYTSFTSATTPALTTWAGAAINIPITDITENGTLVSFNVSGGFPIKQQTVTANAATGVSSTAFTANWDALATATNYYITLKEGNVDEVIETANCGSGTSVSIPYGWYKSFSSSKYYSADGFYGEASPSLKMETNGNYLRTATYTSDVTEVRFWCLGYQNKDNDNLLVEGYANGEWVTISTVSPLPTTGQVITLTDIPDGVKQVRFTAVLNGLAGTIALDDIRIVAGGLPVVSGYDNRSLGNVTSTRITGLTPGMTYKYTVTASDGSHSSKESNAVRVSLPDDGSTTEPETPSTGGDASYAEPSGNTYTDNYLTDFTAANGTDSYHTSWTSHPGSIFNLIDHTVTALPGDEITLSLTANCLSTSTDAVHEDMRYCCAYIYTDWDCDGVFTLDRQYGENSPAANVKANYDEVMQIAHSLTVPADAAVGTSRVRIIYQNAWTALNDGANSTNLDKGIVYDLPVVVKSADTSLYVEPSGNTYTDNYLTDLTVTHSGDAYHTSWTSHPGSIFNLIDYTATARPGDEVTLSLTANSLSTSTDAVYEDMRYCCAYIYTDWDLDGVFTLDRQYGENSPAANIKANYDEVMQIDHTLTVPADAAEGVSRVRVIYQNAWTALNDGANSTNLDKGIVYDLPVNVSRTSVLPAIDATDDASAEYFDLQGRRVAPSHLTPGIYIRRLSGSTSKIRI